MFIWNAVKTLQKFQFPWRFLSVSVFAAAVLGAVAMDHILRKKILLVACCLLLVASTVHMWKPKGYQVKPDNFYSGVYAGTTDTGESAPIWSVRFMEHTAKAPAEVISGNSTIVPLTRTTTLHEYAISAATPSRILDNTLYFPGWKIYVDGVIVATQFQDPDYRGLMTFQLPAGDHTVKIIFEDTRLRTIANLISAISFGMIGVSILVALIWRRKI
jgi:hypothetical protein